MHGRTWCIDPTAWNSILASAGLPGPETDLAPDSHIGTRRGSGGTNWNKQLEVKLNPSLPRILHRFFHSKLWIGMK